MAVLLPHLASVRVDAVEVRGVSVEVQARTTERPAACPACGTSSQRVHSSYQRRLLDTAAGGRQTLIVLRVRRLFCDTGDCPKRTFVEQVPGLTVRHGRRSPVLTRLLQAVGLALGGRPGARLTRRLAASVSRMTLLRLVRGLPDPQQVTPRVLGVDDFALRRGHVYGTILVDMDTRRPIELLGDRTTETLAAWLREHPGVEVVCRDRAGAYAEGVRQGAPDAVQVADRWHVWNNLADAVERTVACHRQHLSAALGSADSAESGAAVESRQNQSSSSELPPDVADDDLRDHPPTGRISPLPAERTDRIAVRTRQRHIEVQALREQGLGVQSIARRLGLARGTVRRFARADTPEELLVHNGTGRRPSLLEEFKPYLRQRWNAGCTNATHLFTEIRARGYRGGIKIVLNYLHAFRADTAIPEPAAKPPSARRVTAWILTDPANIDTDDQRQLDAILAVSPPLATLAGHVRAFATMMRNLHGHQLQDWMAAADTDDLPALHSFVRGLRRDYDAVTAGLTLTHNSGAVEGHVNRLKKIKRQMFGRARPDLLRKRVLLGD